MPGFHALTSSPNSQRIDQLRRKLLFAAPSFSVQVVRKISVFVFLWRSVGNCRRSVAQLSNIGIRRSLEKSLAASSSCITVMVGPGWFASAQAMATCIETVLPVWAAQFNTTSSVLGSANAVNGSNNQGVSVARNWLPYGDSRRRMLSSAQSGMVAFCFSANAVAKHSLIMFSMRSIKSGFCMRSQCFAQFGVVCNYDWLRLGRCQACYHWRQFAFHLV